MQQEDEDEVPASFGGNEFVDPRAETMAGVSDDEPISGQIEQKNGQGFYAKRVKMALEEESDFSKDSAQGAKDLIMKYL